MSGRIMFCVLWLCIVLTLTGCGRSTVPAKDDDAFTIAVMSDTEWYMEDTAWHPVFLKMMQALASSVRELDIKMALHLGDVVNDASNPEQWRRALAGIGIVDSTGIPFLVAVGERDYYSPKFGASPVRDSTQFNNHLGVERYAGKPWFGGSFEPAKADNVYVRIHAGSTEFLFITLEHAPRKEVLQWANDVIAANKQAVVIVATHSYLDAEGNRILADSYLLDAEVVGDNHSDGNDIWRNLIRKHKNIKLVLSGHTSHMPNGGMVTAARRSDKGASRAIVHQLMSNYQAMKNGGNGMLRFLTISPNNRTIAVRTCSLAGDFCLDDDDEQSFALQY